MVVVACSALERTTTTATSATTNTQAPTTTAPEEAITVTTTAIPRTEVNQGDLAGWQLAVVFIDDQRWLVALADDSEERAQGLMGVEDLGELDGMLFAFPGVVDSPFWMKDTLIELDIAFFATDGRLLEVLRMEPCTEDPCPQYRPLGVYRWALEAPAGRLRALDSGSALTFP